MTTVRTTYALVFVARILELGEFAGPWERFDELEQGHARERFLREVARAKAWVGSEREMYTAAGNAVTGVVDRVLVELSESKSDGQWTTKTKAIESALIEAKAS